MRKFSEKNISNFRKLLKKHDWSDLYNIKDANLAFSNFMCNFKSYFDHCFPLQKIKINCKNKNHGSIRKLKTPSTIQIKGKTFININQNTKN